MRRRTAWTRSVASVMLTSLILATTGSAVCQKPCNAVELCDQLILTRPGEHLVGWVRQVRDADAVISLRATDGAREGDQLEVFRPEWGFAEIGRLTITQSNAFGTHSTGRFVPDADTNADSPESQFRLQVGDVVALRAVRGRWWLAPETDPEPSARSAAPPLVVSEILPRQVRLSAPVERLPELAPGILLYGARLQNVGEPAQPADALSATVPRLRVVQVQAQERRVIATPLGVNPNLGVNPSASVASLRIGDRVEPPPPLQVISGPAPTKPLNPVIDSMVFLRFHKKPAGQSSTYAIARVVHAEPEAFGATPRFVGEFELERGERVRWRVQPSEVQEWIDPSRPGKGRSGETQEQTVTRLIHQWDDAADRERQASGNSQRQAIKRRLSEKRMRAAQARSALGALGSQLQGGMEQFRMEANQAIQLREMQLRQMLGSGS